MKTNKLMSCASNLLLSASLLMISTSFSPLKINAAEKPIENSFEREIVAEEMFANFNDTDKVLQTADGGFVHGGMLIESDELGNVLTIYDSENDPNSITVAEAKELIKTETFENQSILPRGAYIPTTVYTVASGVSYLSNKFSGSGWRFSDRQYKAANGTGTYLRWRSLKDSGRVGNVTEASQTLAGNLAGNEIYSSYTYVNKGSATQVYYTYNPVSGTQYEVANI